MQLIDTDILVDVRRGVDAACFWFAATGSRLAVPGFVVMELLQGRRSPADIRKIDEMVAPLQRAWPGPADLEMALALFRSKHLSSGLGLLDALIAARYRT